MNSAQRPGSFDANSVKLIRNQSILELSNGFLVAPFAQHFHRQQATDDVLGILQLRIEHRTRWLKPNPRQHGEFGINSHARWRPFQRKIEILSILTHRAFSIHNARLGFESDSKWELEKEYIIANPLGLLHRNPRQFCPRIPSVG